jgi:putative transposase
MSMDNAIAESFMCTLKREEVNGQAYRDHAEAEASIGTFIDEVYNEQRLRSALQYLPPAAFEARQTVLPGPGAVTAVAAPMPVLVENAVA